MILIITMKMFFNQQSQTISRNDIMEQTNKNISSKEVVLVILQLNIFVICRILDDMTWSDLSPGNEQTIFEEVTIAGLSLCVIMQVIRKCNNVDWFPILFIQSQIKSMISWALITVIILDFYSAFECKNSYEESDPSKIVLLSNNCCLNAIQIFLTNLNYALICNQLANKAEMIVYEMVLFGQIVFNGNLLLLIIQSLQQKQKDISIQMVSLIIANHVLRMDLIFRFAFLNKIKETKILEKFQRRKFTEAQIQHLRMIQQFPQSEENSS